MLVLTLAMSHANRSADATKKHSHSFSMIIEQMFSVDWKKGEGRLIFNIQPMRAGKAVACYVGGHISIQRQYLDTAMTRTKHSHDSYVENDEKTAPDTLRMSRMAAIVSERARFPGFCVLCKRAEGSASCAAPLPSCNQD
jgi:hypothetical protein